jgi:peptidyl-prolyl cis-trans isomerase C
MTSSTYRFSSLGLGCALFAASLSPLGGCGEKKSEEAAAPAPADNKPQLKNGLTEEQSKQVLAKVGDTTITLGQFADRLASQSPYLRARYNSPERRREFLDNMVRFELLAAEAKKRGDDKLPEVERVRRQMMVQEMMKEQFDDKGVKLSDITDEEIKKYYDAHVDEFNKPEQRRASEILFMDKTNGKAKAEAALKKLQAAGGEASADTMEAFRKLAEAENEDPETKDRAGDLRFFSKDPEPGEAAPPKAVRDAIFSLAKTGDLYPSVVESEKGFHVLKMTGQRAPLERTVQDAQRLIQNRLWREKREAAIDKFVGDLRQKADVKENADLLKQVKVDTSGEDVRMPTDEIGAHAPTKGAPKAAAKTAAPKSER